MRNKITMNRILFERLIVRAKSDENPVAYPDAGRFIQRESELDANLLANGSVSNTVLTQQIRVVRVEDFQNIFFCVSGLLEAEDPPSGLEIADLTPALFTLSIVEGNLFPRRNVSSAMIKNILDDRYINNGLGYDGHDLDEIVPLFPSIIVYRVFDKLPYHKMIERVIGAILINNYLDGPVPFNSNTMIAMANIFQSSSHLIPFHNLVQAVLSISWEGAYLDIYRCIEQLYAFPRLSEFGRKFDLRHAVRDIAESVEAIIGWYPKEDEALRTLLELCDNSLIEEVCGAFMCEVGADHAQRCKSAARQIYKLRNRIVDYRPSHERIAIADDKWNSIVISMVAIVEDLYSKCGESFFGGNTSATPPVQPTA
jgi:hypothetical protein